MVQSKIDNSIRSMTSGLPQPVSKHRRALLYETMAEMKKLEDASPMAALSKAKP